MTILRKAAFRVSEFTVRHSSAGSREWAEGLAREVAFIESDWRALAWAIGSTRVLLERRAVSAGAKRRRPGVIDWCGWVWYGLWAFSFAMDAIYAKNWQVRVGSALVSFGLAYFGTRSIAEWLRKGDEPSEFVAGTMYSRALLMRKLARAHTMRRWISPVVRTVGWFGFLLADPHIVWWQRALAIVLVLPMTSIEDSPKGITARIAQVDASLARYEAQRVRKLSAGPVRMDVVASPTFSRLFQRRRRCRRRGLR